MSRALVVAAVAGIVLAAGAGVALVVGEPVAGSTTEAALGLGAAIGGLSAAVFTVAAVVHAQVTGLWTHAPRWLRWVVLGVGIYAIAVTLWSFVA